MEKEQITEYLEKICGDTKDASFVVSHLGQDDKNTILLETADALVSHAEEIVQANQKDLLNAVKNQMPQGLQDRLLLNVDRIRAMADGLRQVASLKDPIGDVLSMWERPNGLRIGKKRVPLGVVGVIYEARPNVTADVFGLCFKTGNAMILKGGSAALYSNEAIVNVITDVLMQHDVPAAAVTLISDTDREVTQQFMKMNRYVDVLIPRGGAGLIRSVVENSTIPVIETGTGNCHIFVDESADFHMALDIIENAKTQRIGVCNACESLVIHEKIVDQFMPLLEERLQKHNVEIRADQSSIPYLKQGVAATEQDFSTEYLDYIISVKTVASVDEAINHINAHNTKHSEAIITESYRNAEKFLDGIDAACVYVNASTRFSDGNEFGFGAEIGISTQKLHARGPMGLEALTTTKYIIYGNGQVRP